MIALGHTATGVIIGLTAYNFLNPENLASGLILTGAVAIVSHYLTDAIPHGHFFKPKDYDKYILPVIIFDLLLPIILLLIFTYLENGLSAKLFYVLFGIGGAQLPDVIEGLVVIGKIKGGKLLKLESDFHQDLHWHGKDSKTLLLGLRDFWQILILVIAVILIASK